MAQKPLPLEEELMIGKLPFSRKDSIQGASFNRWLNENIPDMKPNRFINIWKTIHKKVESVQEILRLEEYIKSTCQKKENL